MVARARLLVVGGAPVWGNRRGLYASHQTGVQRNIVIKKASRAPGHALVGRFIMEQEGSGYGLETNQAVFQIQHRAWPILGWMVANVVVGRRGPMCPE